MKELTMETWRSMEKSIMFFFLKTL